MSSLWNRQETQPKLEGNVAWKKQQDLTSMAVSQNKTMYVIVQKITPHGIDLSPLRDLSIRKTSGPQKKVVAGFQKIQNKRPVTVIISAEWYAIYPFCIA